MSAPDPEELGLLAGATGIDEALLEKDWFVVQTLAAIARTEGLRDQFVFAGGTGLSKAFGLIQRFSEDIDFRVVTTPDRARGERRVIRNRMIEVVRGAGSRWRIWKIYAIRPGPSSKWPTSTDMPISGWLIQTGPVS